MEIMEKEIRFRDLKIGDIIYKVNCQEGTIDARLIKELIICKKGFDSYLRITKGIYSNDYLINPDSSMCYYGKIFTCYTKAKEYLTKHCKIRLGILEKRIDQRVSYFTTLEQFLDNNKYVPINPNLVPLIRDLKRGDPIYLVKRLELKVEKLVVESIDRTYIGCRDAKLISTKGPTCRAAFEGSNRSQDLTLWTYSGNAKNYLIAWAKSRYETVGKEIEVLISEYDKYELALK